MLKVVTLLGLIATVFAQNSTFCSEPYKAKLCSGPGNTIKPHIACIDYWNTQKDPNITPIPMDMSKYKIDILDTTNKYRNDVAGGKVNKLPMAAAMPVIQWSEELEYVATAKALSATTNHDLCRNTPTYRYSGQNIATSSGYGDETTWVIPAVQSWLTESDLCTPDDIIKLPKIDYSRVIQHFTVMCNQWTTHMGCGAVTYQTDTKRFLMVCNFAYTNVRGGTVYKTTTATPGVDCPSTGTDEVYKNLCKV